MVTGDPERRAERISKIQESLHGKPPTTHIHEGFAFETHLVTRRNARALQLRAHPFEGYVGYDVLAASDQIRSNLQPSRRDRQVEAKFVRIYNPRTKEIGEDVGVVAQAIVDISVGGQQRKVLDIGVKAIKPGFRNRGMGARLLVDTLLEHEGITDVSGQSRSGRVFGYLELVRDLGLIGEIRGYEVPLNEKDLEVLKQFLSKTKYKKVSKLRTGLCLGIYPKADPSLFIAPPNNPKAVRIVKFLEENGVPPGGVNGRRYRSLTIEEALGPAREEYARTETVDSAIARSRYEELLEKVRRIGNWVKPSPVRKNLIILLSR